MFPSHLLTACLETPNLLAKASYDSCLSNRNCLNFSPNVIHIPSNLIIMYTSFISYQSIFTKPQLLVA